MGKNGRALALVLAGLAGGLLGQIARTAAAPTRGGIVVALHLAGLERPSASIEEAVPELTPIVLTGFGLVLLGLARRLKKRSEE